MHGVSRTQLGILARACLRAPSCSVVHPSDHSADAPCLACAEHGEVQQHHTYAHLAFQSAVLQHLTGCACRPAGTRAASSRGLMAAHGGFGVYSTVWLGRSPCYTFSRSSPAMWV